MFIEEKKNSQIFQNSKDIYKPEDEEETSKFIKEMFSKNLPIEIIGSNSKSFIGDKKII